MSALHTYFLNGEGKVLSDSIRHRDPKRDPIGNASFYDLFVQDEYGKIRKMVEAAWFHQAVSARETFGIFGEQREQPLFVQTAPMTDERGKTVAVAATVISRSSIPDLLSSHVNELRRCLEIVTSSTSTMIIFCNISQDLRFPLVEANQCTLDALQYDKQEVRSLTLQSLMPAKHLKMIQRLVINRVTNTSAAIKVNLIRKNMQTIPVQLKVRQYVTGAISMLLLEAAGASDYLADSKAYPEDYGKNLRVLMAERDVNTSELAKMTGLSIATISNLRTGKIPKPHIGSAKLISYSLNVNVEDIWPSLFANRRKR